MRPILLALFVLLALPAQALTPEELSALDARYARRAEPAVVKQLVEELEAALAATPEDFELVWRLARVRHWQAEQTRDAKQKQLLGQQTWELGERARKLRPERVEGHFYAAVGIGSYSQAVGILKALTEGLEGKFNERLERALKLDPAYDRAGPLLAKGRYYYELPWPKRDLKKSASFFQQAAERYPEALRPRFYLAETLLADGEKTKANQLLLEVAQGGVAYDPAEGQLVQQWARRLQAKTEE
jgi:hypothetical protein